MELTMKNKTAVVTGGSKGIGLAVTAALAAEGARVVVGSRGSTPELDVLVTERGVTVVPVDLATENGPAELIRAAQVAHGGIDILVNNVGASEPAESIVDFTDEQWQRIFDVTFFSAVRSVRAAIPVMQGGGGGAIVNIGSLNARLPAGMIAPYSAAKAALSNFGKALSEEFAPKGIRVNTISPGPVRTPLWTGPGGFAHLFADQAGTTVEDVMNRLLPESMAITTGRVSEPAEVAELVLFLASNRAGNITGADYVIDGGMLKSVA
ncbi:oxidoreductase [Rhodococcus sp. NPDC058514]|uniref:oxidoreductase n=1 Tax=unclassified Rhodococcus (in: high G+C Gram-positive bacteria) TaxID=192944 RepID=UPI003668C4C3